MAKTIRIDSISIKWAPDEDMDNAESCIAEAAVSYDIGQGSRRIEQLTSGGLYGIEGATDAYRREIEIEELNDLREHLRAFGVSVSNFARLAGRPDLQE